PGAALSLAGSTGAWGRPGAIAARNRRGAGDLCGDGRIASAARTPVDSNLVAYARRRGRLRRPRPPRADPFQSAPERCSVHRLQVRTRRVNVEVLNSGAGIPPDDLERVFERFYRVDKSRDRSTGGAGIGLAIVRMRVRAAGGEVGAESRAGLTRFSFWLPRPNGSARAASAQLLIEAAPR